MSDRFPGPRRVTARREPWVIPTYEPMPPDKNPMFIERRVYQGSRGSVYPLPFYDRISDKKTDRSWDAIHLENDFIHLIILPEMGGRIHVGKDKTNNYDFFYRQDTIKPALVGLAGPWVSGGVEFNWPQHHRPATYMPAEAKIEEHADGSMTVWCSDHDPLARMKGMHGVCLHPDSSLIELKVRAYNRTPLVQTFLWWANVACRVHERYQSFFPPDVYYVADHAKRAMATYPLCQGTYYGVDYGKRATKGIPTEEMPSKFVPPGSYAPNDLSWYANIPVPTSYMCMGSKEDFFGGYDHERETGLIHIANHHISPGKKQWTWGNHPFGYAWDRNLSDDSGPYIEIMAGVYTDNQPDFAFLQPGETKTWSQYWYPIQKIGPAKQANNDAALAFDVREKFVRLGISSSGTFSQARITLKHRGKILRQWIADLAPGQPFSSSYELARAADQNEFQLVANTREGKAIISYQPAAQLKKEVPRPATEPFPPGEISSADELFITGLHLDQYRHATRSPLAYWNEALRRDPGDSRCNNAVGLWHLRRGEFSTAENFFRKSIDRLTQRNPNPYDGDSYYYLGLTLRYLGRDEEAYVALYKSVWNQSWQAAGYHALAEIDAILGNWNRAIDHSTRALKANTDNLRARNLLALVLEKSGRTREANAVLKDTLGIDPLDPWARQISGEAVNDAQLCLDIALDYQRAGFISEAIAVLLTTPPGTGTEPLVFYYLGWLHEQNENPASAKAAFKKGRIANTDYCFPSRLEDVEILKAAIRADPKDSHAPYYLGNLLYDRRRHSEAIEQWEKSVQLDPKFSVAWRNLGIGYLNIERNPGKARHAYEKALRANPSDARILFERDQLWKRLGLLPEKRLHALQRSPDLVSKRDDLTIELASLYNQSGVPEKAAALISERKFQPWEGGEGQALGQYVRTQLLLGQIALRKKQPKSALLFFCNAADIPPSLGEARHLFANQSDVFYWLGLAHAATGNAERAQEFWLKSASQKGDFQEMSLRSFSELTYYSAESLKCLGKCREADRLLRALLKHAKEIQRSRAQIDYFATSLPTMLLFDDDLTERQRTTGLFLEAQARLGLGDKKQSRQLLSRVLSRDPNHGPAADFLRQFA